MTLTMFGVFTVTGTVPDLAMYTGIMIDILKKMNERDERTEIDDAIAELMRKTNIGNEKGCET